MPPKHFIAGYRTLPGLSLALALLLSLGLAACSPVAVAPEQRHVLRTASPELLAPKIPQTPHTWHLLPVRLPSYMDRDELLLPGANGVQPSASRWAELPTYSANRVLAQDLRTLLGSERLLTGTLPAKHAARALRIEITAFDVVAPASVALQARWQFEALPVQGQPQESTTHVHTTRLSAPIAGAPLQPGHTTPSQLEAVAQAHRLALTQLARQIADTLP